MIQPPIEIQKAGPAGPVFFVILVRFSRTVRLKIVGILDLLSLSVEFSPSFHTCTSAMLLLGFGVLGLVAARRRNCLRLYNSSLTPHR